MVRTQLLTQEPLPGSLSSPNWRPFLRLEPSLPVSQQPCAEGARAPGSALRLQLSARRLRRVVGSFSRPPALSHPCFPSAPRGSVRTSAVPLCISAPVPTRPCSSHLVRCCCSFARARGPLLPPQPRSPCGQRLKWGMDVSSAVGRVHAWALTTRRRPPSASSPAEPADLTSQGREE